MVSSYKGQELRFQMKFTKKRGDKEVRQPSQARKELEHQRNKVISLIPIRTVHGKVAISLS